MNLSNRGASHYGYNSTIENSLFDIRRIPCFQTVQRGEVNRETNAAKRKKESEENEKSASSSSTALSGYLSMYGACQFPVVHRNNREPEYKKPCPSSSRTTIPHSTLKHQPSDSAESILSFIRKPSEHSSEAETIRRKYQQYTRNLTYQMGSGNLVTSTSIDNCKFRTPVNKVENNKSSSSCASDGFFQSTPAKRKVCALQTPKTTRTPKSASSSATSGDSSNNVVLALTEGRGSSRGEVGIAGIDMKRPFLILCQISDTQTYANTLRRINILNPVEIIIPNTFYDNMNASQFYQVLSEHFPKVRITTVQRKQFSDSQGYSQIQKLCLEEYSSVLPLIQRKYYALAAAAALLKYAEFQQNMIFSSKSLRVDYQAGDNIMFIDLETAEKLELIVNQNRDYASSSPLCTLFEILNKCSTLGGQKRLRTVILQPSVDQSEVDARLNCVQELCENGDLLSAIKTLLPKLWDVEQLLSLCSQVANLKDNYAAAEVLINQALVLKSSLEVIPALSHALSEGKSKFFISLKKILENDHYEIMLNNIYEVLNEDAHLTHKYEVNLFQRCFTIRTGINSFLDIARIAYSELGQDFNEIVDDLIKEYHLPLTVKTLKSKGPVLHLKINNNFKISSLPSIFIQVQKTRTAITMTTKELMFLKERMNHFVQEIQLLSSTIIFEMLQDIREYMGALYKFCENIAELDLIVSFALISKHFTFVRPVFSANRMSIKSSVHPILNQIAQNKPVANDIVASSNENMCIITGPNMGGKSIYIRQVALLQIMAQIGCYVPATSAEFRLTDRIFSRIGFHDNIESNASTFIVEIREMQYILKSLTPRSLIIIDELCRGTSTEEGTALAWAICEELIASTAFIFFASHFLFLTKLQDLYPNVTNNHLEALEVNSNTNTCHLIYTHRLVPGVLKLDHYGLKLARSTAIPESVMKVSEEMAQKLTLTWKACSIVNEVATCEKQINNVILHLLDTLDNDMLTLDVIREIVDHVKEVGLLSAVHTSNENTLTNTLENNESGECIVDEYASQTEAPDFDDSASHHSDEPCIQPSEAFNVSEDDDELEDAKEELFQPPTFNWSTPVNTGVTNLYDNADVYYSDLILGDKGGSIPVNFDRNIRAYFSH